MSKVLVLEGAGFVIPEELVVAIESVASTDEPGLWLPSLLTDGPPASDAPRRALQLRDGGRVEVPATMTILDDIDVLELPALLRQIGHARGVIGLAQLPDGLKLVCDPNLLAGGRQ